MHPVICTLLLHGAHPDKPGGTAEMVAWRMDGGAAEVLSEWVVDVDRELMEREVANREKEGKVKGQREFAGRAGRFGDLRAQTVACQAIDRSRTTLNMLSFKSHSHIDPRVYPVVFSLSPNPAPITPTPIPSTQTDCDGVIDYCITSTKLPPSFGSPLAPPSPGPAPLSMTTAFRALAMMAAPLRSSSSTLRSPGVHSCNVARSGGSADAGS